MTQQPDSALRIWLYTTCFFIVVMVILGGYVRLTRSGLSMTDWDVVHGLIPPVGQEAWEEEFEQYQQSPEFKEINYNMSLAEFKPIFYREYIHRVLGRVTGLIFVLPLFLFLIMGKIKLKRSGIYLGIGILFALQGLWGWYMVKSGLIHEPEVSHYRLAGHLLLALALLGLTFWAGLNATFGQAGKSSGDRKPALYRMSVAIIVLIFFQILYGAFLAGMKAGYVSNTFPLMMGQLIPQGMLSGAQSGLINLVENPVAVHFIHRWFAFVVFLFGLGIFIRARKYASDLRKVSGYLLAVIMLQILIGLTVIWTHVNLPLALIHQGGAILVLVSAVYLAHRGKA